jgi:hypothetical protein
MRFIAQVFSLSTILFFFFFFLPTAHTWTYSPSGNSWIANHVYREFGYSLRAGLHEACTIRNTHWWGAFAQECRYVYDDGKGNIGCEYLSSWEGRGENVG